MCGRHNLVARHGDGCRHRCEWLDGQERRAKGLTKIKGRVGNNGTEALVGAWLFGGNGGGKNAGRAEDGKLHDGGREKSERATLGIRPRTLE